MSILQAYSVLGGIPYYLSLLDFNESVAENPDKQWTQVVVITTKGLKRNAHSDVAKKELTMDELFGE